MTYEDSVKYIETNTWSTTRLGLGRTAELLNRLGNPQNDLKFIHVAGSNGKGSTCAMLASIMKSAGYKTGLYISPHLEDFRERFSINGRYIEKNKFAEITEKVKIQAEKMDDHPSQFEISTAIAMMFFADEHCDIVVLEVGMGGALDSTNVIENTEVAVIMNIGLEHTEYLGNSLKEIATTKAGIIKRGCDVVYYPNDSEVEEAIKTVSASKSAKCMRADFESIEHIVQNIDGQVFSWGNMENIKLPLLGKHQEYNAVMAIETALVIKNRGWKISEESIREGIEKTVWHARMEILNKDPLYILDGGHNPQCAQALSVSLPELLKGEKATFIIGILGDKDYVEVIKYMIPYAERFICVTPENDRALPAVKLEKTIKGITDTETVVCDSIKDAVDYTMDNDYKKVICFGSLYLAGEFRPVFYQELKKYQRKKGIAARDSLTKDEIKEKSQKICEIIRNTDEYKNAKIIMSYKAINSEVDLKWIDEVALKDNKTVVYPKCEKNREMIALSPNSAGAFVSGKYDIMEPDPNDSVLVQPENIDLVLCPATAVDQNGTRVGMGGGYYDRYLPKCKDASKICVIFEVQKILDAVKEETDFDIDAYITENGIKYM